jgi:hypothetical protein
MSPDIGACVFCNKLGSCFKAYETLNRGEGLLTGSGVLGANRAFPMRAAQGVKGISRDEKLETWRNIK